MVKVRKTRDHKRVILENDGVDFRTSLLVSGSRVGSVSISLLDWDRLWRVASSYIVSSCDRISDNEFVFRSSDYVWDLVVVQRLAPFHVVRSFRVID